MNPTESTPSYTYYVGGSLEINDPTYVTRQADQDFYESLRAGNFCYVFNSRQMGKSSLKVRTMQRLQAEGFACASIYITATGSQDITADKWYAGIMRGLVNGLGLESRINLRNWLRERDMLSPVQRFSEFIETVILREIVGRVVIFIDEIDSVLSLDFGIDDFFAVIRECADRRGGQPEYKRLTFALLGVIAPADLIKDKRRTPFNTARQAIDLTGFTLEEAQPLALGFQGQADNPQAVLRSVLGWTGGQPFLTQKVCKLISALPTRIEAGAEGAVVERVIREQVVERWEEQDVPEHLKTISDRLLRGNKNEQVKGRLLGLYQQILESDLQEDPPQPPLKRGGNQDSTSPSPMGENEYAKPPFLRGVGGISGIPADESYEQMQLRLTGLVVKRGGRLIIYNPIYAEVFGAEWIAKALQEIRPDFYGVAIEAWQQAAPEQKGAFLLRGQALLDSEAWAQGKRLSDADEEFLSESREEEKNEMERRLELERKKREAMEESNRLDAERRAQTRSIILIMTLISIVLVGLWTSSSVREAAKKQREAEQKVVEATQNLEAAKIDFENRTQQLQSVQSITPESEEKKREAQQRFVETNRVLVAAMIELQKLTQQPQGGLRSYAQLTPKDGQVTISYFCQPYQGGFATFGKYSGEPKVIIDLGNRQNLCKEVANRFQNARDNGNLRFLVREGNLICGTDRNGGECKNFLFAADTITNADEIFRKIMNDVVPIDGSFITQ